MPRPARRIAQFLTILLTACWLPPAHAAAPAGDLVRAELIAEPAAIAPGRAFWVSLRLAVKDGWHVYWRNPGDSGEAVAIAWQLPAGYAAGPIVWPTPSRIPVAHLVNYGYEREALLLTQITPPAAGSGGAAEIAADVSWLVCEKICIPGSARVSLALPAAASGAAPQADPQMRAAFERARAALPRSAPWSARLEAGTEWLSLQVTAPGLKPEAVRSAYFFPYADTLVRHAAPQQLQVTKAGLSLKIERSASAVTLPTESGGVLVLEEMQGSGYTERAYELANVRIVSASSEGATFWALLQAVVLAMLGGLILNLMPCVFPVLSIKVLGLVEHSGGEAGRVREHGLAYTGGVLAAFAVLGGLLLGLRAAGAEVGWGFQLQSPVTVALLAYVLFAVGLSLSGAFYVGGSFQGIGARLMRRSDLSGSFATGVLAAVVATPCTAPFMATAVGFAVTQPAPIALSVMLALGLGLALPFLALTLAPHLLGRLPRPGAWMDTLKQLLAFPVYATVAWLVWVLGQQVDAVGLFAALMGLVVVGLAAWALNHAQRAQSWSRRLALGTAAASLVAVMIAVAALARSGPATISQTASAGSYEPFSRSRLAELIAADRPVFVNMTAAWCITCLVNEQVALSNAAVRAAFANRNVAYLKGDWTRRDPEIARVLERHGRSGVPLYLLYAGGSEPVVLPQILTPAIVLGELDRIGGEPRRRASLPTTKE